MLETSGYESGDHNVQMWCLVTLLKLTEPTAFVSSSFVGNNNNNNASILLNLHSLMLHTA